MRRGSCLEHPLRLFLIFLRFGASAWGGPVAQIAMLREELVERRGWVAPERFRRALALYQALPGPEAHELCVWLGMVRGGRWGGLLAGLGFMLPGLAVMLALAAAYRHLGAATLLPLIAVAAPAVAALIVRAAHRIAASILVDLPLVAAALAAMALTLLGVHFILVFAVCAAWQGLWAAGRPRAAMAAAAALSTAALALAMPGQERMVVPGEGGSLFLEGLKGGLLSFGGAYTAIPFLRDSMVGVYPGVTPQSVLDGIAIASVIPAPLILFGTFLGYLAGGLGGALAMTAGLFLPAFGFTLAGHAQLERLMAKPALHGVLDGISAAVVGLLAVTAFAIVRDVVDGPVAIATFAAALAAFYLLRGAWLAPAVILAAGAAGIILETSPG